MSTLQALEWVILHITDVRTLAACSLLNQSLHNTTVSHIKQNLHLVLGQANLTKNGKQSLKWLLKCAGPAAVNTAASKDAFLQQLATMKTSTAKRACKVWVKAGADQPKDLVVAAAKHRVPHVAELSTALHGKADWPAAHTAHPWLLHVAIAERHEVVPILQTISTHQLLDHITPEEVPELLHLACNNKWGSGFAMQILQEDAARLHVLQPQQAPDAPPSQQDPQLKQQRTELVVELLKTCVLRRHKEVVNRLLALPAAKHIGASIVAELLHWAMTHSAAATAAAPAYAGDCSSDDDDFLADPYACDDGFLRDITSSFLQLPGAQDMPSNSISSILRCGMHCSSLDVMYDESQLLQLPGAQQSSSEVLCDLLKEAGSLTPWRRRANLLSAMGRIVRDRQLDRQHVLGVLKHSIDINSDYAFRSSFKLGKHITGADVVDLLHYATSEGRSPVDSLRFMHSLSPAVQLVDDVQGFVAALESIINVAGPFGGSEVVRSLLRLPVAEQLQPHQCLELARIWPSPYRSYMGTYVNKTCAVWDLPQMQQLNVAQLTDMLLNSIVKSDVLAVPKLLSFPASAYLSPSSFCEAVQQLCGLPAGGGHEEAFQALLSLPVAQDMSELSCHELLTAILQVVQTYAGVRYAGVRCLGLLLEQLPVMSHVSDTQLPPESLKAVTLGAAASGDVAMLLRCLGHAQAVSLPSEVVFDMLRDAPIRTWAPSVMSGLQSLPCGQLMQPCQLVQVLEHCVRYKQPNDPVLQQWLELEPVQQLPAAWVSRLLLTLMGSDNHLWQAESWLSMSQVLELPGAQQLGAGEVVAIVGRAVLYQASTNRMPDIMRSELQARQAFAMAALQLSGAQGMTADSAVALGNNCLVKGWRSHVECILKLPCAAMLSMKQVQP